MARFSLDINQSDFNRAVVELSRRVPVVVDFWAPWCEPCKVLKPLLEKLAEEYQGRFILVKINSDENQQLAQQLGVRSIPSVKAFVGGDMVDEFNGALPESQLRAFIDALLPSPAEPLREEAAGQAVTGDLEGALATLVEASQLDPKHEDVRLDAAEILIRLGRPTEAEELLGQTYQQAADRAQALRARLKLSSEASGIDRPALATRLAADANDHAARLQLARADAAAGDYRSALENLLEIVRRDRSFEEDAGRKAMLEVFEVLSGIPEQSDLLREYRRALASALN